MTTAVMPVRKTAALVDSTPPESFVAQIWPSILATIVLGIICCAIYPLVVYGIAQLFFPVQANGSLVKADGSFTTKDAEAVGSALLGENFGDAKYFHPRPSAAGAGYDATNSSASNYGPLSDKLINGATQTAAAPATAPAATAASSGAASQPVETLAYDGIRLRAIHYAVDNSISFKLYYVKSDGTRNEAALAKFEDAQGNLNDVALVDAFPHAGDAADKIALIAAEFSSPIPADAVTASASGLDPHISPLNALMQKARIAKVRGMSESDVQKLIDQNTDQRSLGILGDPGVNVLMLNLALDKAKPIVAAVGPSASAPAAAPVAP